MYKRIFIATHGSALSRKAVDSRIDPAALAGAQVFALKVVLRYPVSYFEGGMALSLKDVATVEKQWADAAVAVAVAVAVVETIKAQAEAWRVKTKATSQNSDLWLPNRSLPPPKNTNAT